MIVDEKDFFREATLRICSSLEIEKALWDCFMYIRAYIPGDIIMINIYDPRTGIGEIVAMADVQGGRITSFKTSFPPETRAIIDEWQIKPDLMPRIYLAEQASKDPIMKPFAQFLKEPDATFMGIGPKAEWNLIAGFFIGNHSGHRYSEEHLRLFRLLNDPCSIALYNYLRYRELSQLKDMLADDNRYLQEEIRQQAHDEIIGAHYGLKQVMEMVNRVAPLFSPVLLLGETGAGKEVIATAIHNLSPRRERPFIKVNCGAIPESLMDSELFGHEKGAFTGAFFQKRGRFERAHGGTIFLDEIGELTPRAQIRLLRVIQEKEIERVGGTEPISVDVRVIAATHRNLDSMLAEGKFREDLYFRLKVFPIVIPPLRDRRIDIPSLVQHIMLKKAREMDLIALPTLAPGSIDILMNYHWPGNVRELQNVVERALILCPEEPLDFYDLLEPPRQATPNLTARDDEDTRSLDEVISQRIRAALKKAGGQVGGEKGAARLLKMNPATLRSKMRKLGIPFGRKALE